MVDCSREVSGLNDRELFHREQWTSLFVGIVISGMSLRPIASVYRSVSFADRSWLAPVLAFLNVHWSLVISVDLVVLSLLRFLFRPWFKAQVDPAPPPTRDSGAETRGGSDFKRG